jgi:asparagine synthase (glutamine-hydrolysing)
MCGIAGLIGISPDVAQVVAKDMQAALRHRGPDDQGIEIVRDGAFRSSPVTLVHTRLAIVDLSPLGHQPMRDVPLDAAQSPNWVVFNGEIYNFREIATDLQQAGRPSRTRCDTEVILNGYRAWGDQAAERFEGMFAWCLVDTSRGVAWLCRDRVGMKPLYIYERPAGGLLFASEVRALLAARSLVDSKLDRVALESYLAQGAVMGERSIVQGVRMLGPGESLMVDLEGRPISKRRYWSVHFDSQGSTSLAAAPAAAGSSRHEVVAELSSALRRAVSQMLLADVPVGLLLSSGIDSSVIAVIAAEVSSRQLRTVSVGFDVEAFDESTAAERFARELGTAHSTIRLDGQAIVGSIESVLQAVDQPSVDGFNTFYATRAAREAGVSVALSGVGGDELFGGYSSFRELPPARQMLRLLGPGRVREGARFLADNAAWIFPALRRGRVTLKVREALRRAPELVALYCLRRELLLPQTRRALHALPAGSDAATGMELGLLENLRQERSRHDLDGVAFLEFSMYMRHMLLRDSDVFSMAQPLELRLPLLEHAVVASAARARAHWRRPDPRPKPLLIDAAGPRLPSAVWRKRKQGFTLPWEAWLRGPLAARAVDSLGSRSVWQDLGFDAAAVQRLWQRFQRQDPAVPALAVLALMVLGDFAGRFKLAA